MEEEKQNCALEMLEAKDALQKVSVEPERIRKQAECVSKAAEKLAQEIARVTERHRTYDREIKRHRSARAHSTMYFIIFEDSLSLFACARVFFSLS